MKTTFENIEILDLNLQNFLLNNEELNELADSVVCKERDGIIQVDINYINEDGSWHSILRFEKDNVNDGVVFDFWGYDNDSMYYLMVDDGEEETFEEAVDSSIAFYTFDFIENNIVKGIYNEFLQILTFEILTFFQIRNIGNRKQ